MTARAPTAFAALVGWMLALCVAVLAPPASAASESSAASLAAANMYKTAGTCAVNPTHNSLGGAQYETSCSGYAGHPEYWCADFAKWIWANSGFDVQELIVDERIQPLRMNEPHLTAQ